MKYPLPTEPIPQSARKQINEKLLYLIDNDACATYDVLRFVFVCVPYCAAAALLYFPERSFLKTASTKLNEDLIQHVGVSQRKLTHGFMVCSLCFFCFFPFKDTFAAVRWQ